MAIIAQKIVSGLPKKNNLVIEENKLGDHEMQNVFVHEDGIVSTPFCNSGNSIIYAWFNGKYPPSEVTQCKCNKCTCHINSPIERKGNELEKLEFWK